MYIVNYIFWIRPRIELHIFYLSILRRWCFPGDEPLTFSEEPRPFPRQHTVGAPLHHCPSHRYSVRYPWSKSSMIYLQLKQSAEGKTSNIWMFFCTVPSKSCNCAKSQGSPIHQCCVILVITGGIRGPAPPHYARTVNLVFLNICKVLLVFFFWKEN